MSHVPLKVKQNSVHAEGCDVV